MIEFGILAVRPELDLHSRKLYGPNWVTPEVQQEMRSSIRSQLDGQDLIISCEGLSFIHSTEEVDRLRELLDPYELDFIVVQRERADFLRSYRQWMKQSDIKRSADPESCRYVENDSWILDFDRFPALFPGVRTIDYQQAMNEWGSIIPALMEGLGADPSTLPAWSDYRVNPALTRKDLMMRAVERRLRRTLRRTLRR